MKENTKKTEMIVFLVEAWGVIRKILAHPKVNIGATISHSLESYIQAMQGAEGESIGELEHESNAHANKQSMKIPPDEKNNGYLEGGAIKPLKKHWKCPSCGMNTTQYPANHEQVKEIRKDKIKEWKAVCKQYGDSQKDNSIIAPINEKTGKSWTRFPTNPSLPPLLIVCKGNKMTHTHGKGSYKCPNCKDRSCGLCKNHCTFVCSTE